MLTSLRDHKGITLVESMIAIFLTAIAVISILPMQDMSLRTGAKSDHLGRAAGIMQAELEMQEYRIMNVSNVVNPGPEAPKSVTVSGLAAVAGDLTFTVNTSIAAHPVSANSWLVNVRVTWPGGPANGISSSMIASRQMTF